MGDSAIGRSFVGEAGVSGQRGGGDFHSTPLVDRSLFKHKNGGGGIFA